MPLGDGALESLGFLHGFEPATLHGPGRDHEQDRVKQDGQREDCQRPGADRQCFSTATTALTTGGCEALLDDEAPASRSILLINRDYSAKCVLANVMLRW